MKKGSKNAEFKVGAIKKIKITFEGLDECITIRKSDKGTKSAKVHKRSKRSEDICRVCKEDLYHNEDFTKRIAISEEGTVTGWLCPFCFSEFTLKDELVQLMTKEPQGEA